MKDYQKPEDLLGQDGLLQQLTKALVERALNGDVAKVIDGIKGAGANPIGLQIDDLTQ